MRAPHPPSLGDGGAEQNESKLVMALSWYMLSPLRAHLQEDLQRQPLRSADTHQDARGFHQHAIWFYPVVRSGAPYDRAPCNCSGEVVMLSDRKTFTGTESKGSRTAWVARARFSESAHLLITTSMERNRSGRTRTTKLTGFGVI